MLPKIIDEVYASTKNADAAKQFAEWSHSAEFDSVVKAYADCHRDPNIDDSFITVSYTHLTLPTNREV